MTERQSEQQPEHPEPEPEPQSRQVRRDAHVRERLREVEAERDSLRERLDARDRRTVEARAKAVLGQYGSGLFSYDLRDLRDPETGDLMEERVQEALEPLRAALEEGRSVHHGDMGARRTAPQKREASWGEFLNRAR